MDNQPRPGNSIGPCYAAVTLRISTVVYNNGSHTCNDYEGEVIKP